MKKGDLFLGLFLGVILASGCVSALGLSPATREVNYEPGIRQELDYFVTSGQMGREISIYAEGNFTEYITFSTNKVYSSGSFKVYFTLPAGIETPGRQRVLIVAKEEPPQNAPIGGAVSIRAPIYVYVPYPGKYIESYLTVPDAGVGDIIPVELKVTNRGKETVTVSPVVNIYDSDGKSVGEIVFKPVEFETNEGDYFIKAFDTGGLVAGVYTAKAVVDYNGERQEIAAKFKVGDLDMEILNFSSEFESGRVNKFVVRGKSNWNSQIDRVFAEFSFFNESFRAEFRTPTVDFKPWEEKSIEGFFDAAEIPEGEYQMGVKIIYLDKNVYRVGSATFSGAKMQLPSMMIIAILALVVLMCILLIFTLMRKKK